MNKQEMVLVVARTNVTPDLLNKLQIIIPTLQLVSPFSLYSSTIHKITADNLYEALHDHFNNSQGLQSLTKTLKLILQEKQNSNNFRICILGGQKIKWDVVLQCKRKNIIIDTVGSNLKLSQISYTTGGISRKVTANNMIKEFLVYLSMSRGVRGYFALEENRAISFTVECRHCKRMIQDEFISCCVCIAVFCKDHNTTLVECPVCSTKFDSNDKGMVQNEQSE